MSFQCFKRKKDAVNDLFSVSEQENDPSGGDKSLKGSIDFPIRELLVAINHNRSFVTTSSCSGRISVYLSHSSGKKNKGELLISSHNLISNSKVGCSNFTQYFVDDEDCKNDQLSCIIDEEVINSFKEYINDRFYKMSITTVYDKKNLKEINISDFNDTNIVWLNFEPFVVHVESISENSANMLLKTALKSGLKQSGIIHTSSNKYIIAIRDSVRIQVPIGITQNSNIEFLVDDKYLKLLLEIANKSFKKTWKRIDLFHQEYKDNFASGYSRDIVDERSSIVTHLPPLDWNRSITSHILSDKSGFSIAFEYPYVIIFGGIDYKAKKKHWLSAINVISNNTVTLDEPEVSVNEPKSRWQSILVSLKYNHMFLLCGGYQNEKMLQYYSDFYMIYPNHKSVQKWKIRKIHCSFNTVELSTRVPFVNDHAHIFVLESNFSYAKLMISSKQSISTSFNVPAALKSSVNLILKYHLTEDHELSVEMDISSNEINNSEIVLSPGLKTNSRILINYLAAHIIESNYQHILHDRYNKTYRTFHALSEVNRYENQIFKILQTMPIDISKNKVFQICINDSSLIMIVNLSKKDNAVDIWKLHFVFNSSDILLSQWIHLTSVFEPFLSCFVLLTDIHLMFILLKKKDTKILLASYDSQCEHSDEKDPTQNKISLLWLGIKHKADIKKIKLNAEAHNIFDNTRKIITIDNLKTNLKKLIHLSLPECDALFPVNNCFYKSHQSTNIYVDKNGVCYYEDFPSTTNKMLPVLLNISTSYINAHLSSEKSENSKNLPYLLANLLIEYGNNFNVDTSSIIKNLPSKWERLGDVVLFPQSDFTEITDNDFWNEVCKIFNCRAAGVVRPIQGILRKSANTLLNSTNGKVVHKENSINYVFDVTQCMFSSGNGTERKRIVVAINTLNMNSGIFVDMYCGIGYFTLPVLKYCPAFREVWCCDWNDVALKFLKEALAYNDISLETQKKLKILHGDSRALGLPIGPDGGSLEFRASCISLGLIPSSQGGWRAAARLIHPLGCLLFVHGVYPYPSQKKKVNNAKQIYGSYVQKHFLKILNETRGPFWNVDIRHVEKVKSYCPYSNHYVAEVYCVSG